MQETIGFLKASDAVIAVCTLLGPILAVQAQKWVELVREKKQRKLAIFRTLMATRAANLSAAHVEALNSVPIEFYSDKRVMDEWETYFQHLNSGPVDQGWMQSRVNLFIQLLVTIGRRLGYRFNVAQMHRIYSPTGHGQIEADQETIRRGVAGLFKGETTIPMNIVGIPTSEASIKLQERAAGAYAADGSLKVTIQSGDLPE